MIYDLLEVFKKEYDEKGDKLILDNYVLKDGLYVKVHQDSRLEYYYKSSKKVKQNGKNIIEHFFKDSNGNIQDEDYEWFKIRDYYSSVLDNAKVFDAPKKIVHNNNYLTLFMKKEQFSSVEFEHIENKLFRKVLSFKSFDSRSEKKILQMYCNDIKSFGRKKNIVKKYKILKRKFLQIQNESEPLAPKLYVKIFFNESLKKYKKESDIYFGLKIFNDNKYSINIDTSIYGLSNSNMGLNSKKAYLEQKTRKITTPFMLINEDAILVKKFFDWLQGQKYRTDLIDNVFLKRHSENGEPVINDFDYLPIKIEKFDEPILIKNYLHIKDKEDYELNELWQLEKVVDEVFYNKQLIFNYFQDEIKLSGFLTKELQNLLYMTKFSMVNYFKKYDDREFYQVVKKYGNSFVVDHLKNGRETKSKESLNLKLALLKHKGEGIMDIESMFKNLKERLVGFEYQELSKEEFFFLSGQVAYYLLAQKEQHQKKQDLLEPFLRCNNAKKLKKELQFNFFQYKHALFFNAQKFNNALALIQAYDKNERMSDNMDSFLVGYLSDNLFFEKKES